MEDQTFGRRDFLKTAAATTTLAHLTSCSLHREPPGTAQLAAPANSTELCFTSARNLAALIRRRTVSAREVMAAHLERIGRLNPRINAIVAKLDDDECLRLADAADRRVAAGGTLPPL